MNYVIEGSPLSVNNAKKPARINGHLRMINTRKTKAWKEAACWSLKSQRGTTPTITGPVHVILTNYLPTTAGDVDNYAKATLDAMQEAGIIANDRQVQRIEMVKKKDASRPRVEIEVTMIEL